MKNLRVISQIFYRYKKFIQALNLDGISFPSYHCDIKLLLKNNPNLNIKINLFEFFNASDVYHMGSYGRGDIDVNILCIDTGISVEYQPVNHYCLITSLDHFLMKTTRRVGDPTNVDTQRRYWYFIFSNFIYNKNQIIKTGMQTPSSIVLSSWRFFAPARRWRSHPRMRSPRLPGPRVNPLRVCFVFLAIFDHF